MTDSQPQTKFLKLTRAIDVVPTAVTWAHTDLIPLRTITIVAGMSGIGKTTLVLLWLAQLTQGHLPGEFLGKPQHVLIMSPEDDPGAVTRPRLEAAGADLTRVHFVSVTRRTETDEIETTATFPTDINLLREAVEQTGAVAILLDPIASLIDGNLDKREDVRAAFDTLAGEIANRYELAVILIAHNKKGTDTVRHKISGSTAITDAARSVLALARDEETEQLILSVDKSSYSTSEGTNYAYALTNTPIALPDGKTTNVARAVFVGESTVSVADINDRGTMQDDDDRNAAQSFILDFLKATTSYEAIAGDVLKAGRAAGFNDQELKDARRRCRNPRVVSAKSGFGAGWVWQLSPEGGTEGGEGGAYEKPATFATFVPPSVQNRGLGTVTPIRPKPAS
ncbi:hypothetical protein BH09ACT6_BH09ACT6_05880 [soil metagenome]